MEILGLGGCRRLIGLASVAFGLVGAGARLPPSPRVIDPPSLVIRFLDVGQAEATLVTVGHQAVLVDASRGDDITEVLHEFGVDSLVAAVASHNHDDHIGGMDAVIADFRPGRFYGNGRAPDNSSATSVADWLARRQIAAPRPPWDPIHLGDVRITVLPPPRLDPTLVSENNSSLGVLIERGGFRALLTGDSEVDQLNGWLKSGAIPRVNVLKAAHHGARNGVTPGWLDRTRPEVVVISAGRDNQYGHPDPWALRYYQARGRRVHRTDTEGTVTVTVEADGRYQVATSGPTPR